jgi:hypothetical protein
VDPNGDLYVGSGLRSTKGYREPGEGYDVINAYMWNPDTRSQNVRFAGFTIQTKIFVATVVDPTTSAEKTRIFDDARSLDPNIGPLIVTVIESEKTRDEIRADASRRMKTLLPRK